MPRRQLVDAIAGTHPFAAWARGDAGAAARVRELEHQADESRRELHERLRDACVSPVLTFAEAPSNEHIAARGSLIELDGVTQHAPAPRFSRTPASVPSPPAREATDIDTVWT